MGKGTAYSEAPRVAPEDLQHLTERVILIRRIAKVTAGGKNLRFNALVAVGDSEGAVGLGLGKATAVPDAVRKGEATARRNLIRVPIKGTTVPHDIRTRYRASSVIIKPAVNGTGVKAGATVRAVLELAGVKDVMTKAMGNRNPINLALATMEALALMRNPEEETERRRAAMTAVARR